MLVIIRSLGVMIRFLGDVLDCFGPKLVKKKNEKIVRLCVVGCQLQ
jgi:hypothetical protein